jgi:hypothetical protein
VVEVVVQAGLRQMKTVVMAVPVVEVQYQDWQLQVALHQPHHRVKEAPVEETTFLLLTMVLAVVVGQTKVRLQQVALELQPLVETVAQELQIA